MTYDVMDNQHSAYNTTLIVQHTCVYYYQVKDQSLTAILRNNFRVFICESINQSINQSIYHSINQHKFELHKQESYLKTMVRITV